MKSMTGYGAQTLKVQKGRIFVEVKSVNHRYCEIALRIPPRMNVLEPKIRDWVQKKIYRGKVDVFIKEVEPVWGEVRLVPDVHLAKQYQKAIQSIRKSLRLSGSGDPLSLVGVSSFIRPVETHGDYNRLWSSVRLSLDKALSGLETMRKKEGTHILKDQKDRVRKTLKLISKIEKLSKNNWEKKQNGFAVTTRLGNKGEEVCGVDTKADITEELIRLSSHLKQYQGLLAAKEPVGRKLDFYIQEMHRELNTVGAKACDAKISGYVVDCKAELEKLREQAQNVE